MSGKTIQEEMQKLQSLQLSPKEVLESYNHVVLTDEEMVEALIEAKRLKLRRIDAQKIKDFEEQNRRLKTMKWNFDIIKGWMLKRAEVLFKGKFILDDDNEELFDLLCNYFIDDEVEFSIAAKRMGVDNPSLKKGNLICGNFGVGKTWLMILFSRNAKQSFEIIRAKQISEAFLQSKEKKIPEYYIKPFKTQDPEGVRAFVNAEVFYQEYIGLCVDEFGSEDMKNNFGNKMNVIGDLIEHRYEIGYTGPFLHGTTNITADELKNFYGERVTSRMREIFNFIELPGNDRRK